MPKAYATSSTNLSNPSLLQGGAVPNLWAGGWGYGGGLPDVWPGCDGASAQPLLLGQHERQDQRQVSDNPLNLNSNSS